MSNAEIISFIAVIVSLIATGLQVWKWNSGEQPVAITTISMAMVREMRQDIADLRARVLTLEVEVEKKDALIDSLERENAKLRKAAGNA